VVLAYAHDCAVGGDDAVGVAVAHRHCRLGRDHDWLAARFEPVDALIGPFGEPHDAVAHPPRRAAVLVYPGAGVPRRSEHVGGGGAGVEWTALQCGAAALSGSLLRPPHVTAVNGDRTRRRRRPHHQLRGDRRRPRPERHRVA
jgi:hypothetical protein